MSLVPNGIASRDRVTALLDTVAAFQGLEQAVLSEIAELAVPVAIDANATLVRQGDPGDAVYVLVSGNFDVVFELPSGVRHVIARLGAGACVGEMALLSRGERTASVIAREPAHALRLDATAFDALMLRHPAVRRQLEAYSARRLPSLRLATSGLFVGVDPSYLQRFDREANWVRLRGGDLLFAQGDSAEDMYVVVHGSLDVVVTARDGRSRLVDVLEAGSSVGEMALLTDEARSATVRAIRDCELVRVAKDEFMRLLHEHPHTAVELARTLVKRLRQTTVAPHVLRFARTVALVPTRNDVVPLEFSRRLQDALRDGGDTVLCLSSASVDAELGEHSAQSTAEDAADWRLLDWLREREDRYRYIIYECDAARTPWTERCLRQADLVLAVARADDDHQPGDVEHSLTRAAGNGAARPRYELVLLHSPDTVRPAGTARWLDARQAGVLAAHHHVRVGRAGDIARVARSITGASLGLALSGGGARGFAQIGVMRALAEHDLAVDMVGGTSMGALMAGLHALGHDIAAMTAVSRKAFIGFEVMSDLTVPMVSLMRGASSVKLCQMLFGDVQIEDLWIPYFCVSSNLTRAEVVVHDRGPLWLWTRASSSIPGIAPPVPYRGDLLVDGGVLNNLPADIMRRRCRGSVVAVNVAASVELHAAPGAEAAVLSGWPQLARALNPLGRRAAASPGIVRILTRSATLGSVHDQMAMRDVADLYLHPPTDGIDPLDWKSIDEAVHIGYRDAYERIAEWKNSDSRTTGMHAAMRRTGSWQA